eukprot:9118789-Alexandrium_andersonii.AAC.1
MHRSGRRNGTALRDMSTWEFLVDLGGWRLEPRPTAAVARKRFRLPLASTAANIAQWLPT